MPNKLVLVQIKSIVNSLTGNDLEKLYNKFSKLSHITRNTKQVGYKCFETSIQLKNINAQGFGRNENEAQHNTIKNLIDIMLDQDESFLETFQFLKIALKELKESDDESKEMSSMMEFDGNYAELEQLGKNIGNISMIKTGNVTQANNDNTLCQEETILIELENNKKESATKKKEIETNKIEMNKENKENIKQKDKEKKEEKQFQPTIAYNNNNCNNNCQHEQELRKEKLKVEHLELRMKLILEENRILKSMLNDQNQKPQQEVGNSQRSHRCPSADETKRNNGLLSKMSNREPQVFLKGKIPKLNLEILPNFQKQLNSNSINSYLMNLYNNNHKLEESKKVF